MVNSILGIVPLAQSTAIAVDNLEFLNKPNKDASDFIGQAGKNIITTSLLGSTANIIGSI